MGFWSLHHLPTPKPEWLPHPLSPPLRLRLPRQRQQLPLLRIHRHQKPTQLPQLRHHQFQRLPPSKRPKPKLRPNSHPRVRLPRPPRRHHHLLPLLLQPAIPNQPLSQKPRSPLPNRSQRTPLSLTRILQRNPSPTTSRLRSSLHRTVASRPIMLVGRFNARTHHEKGCSVALRPLIWWPLPMANPSI